MKKLLVILGPTSTGKTDLALQLARKFQGELVSADSRQVYRGLDIGTGKLPSAKFKVPASPAKRGEQSAKLKKHKGFWEIGGIRVWMYNVVSLRRQYTVADYVSGSIRVIGEIRKRGRLPVVVGGTGLYLKVLIEGLSYLQTPVDKNLRKKLINLSLHKLQNKLKKISLNKWNSMNNSDQNNPRRLVRAIELTLGGNLIKNQDRHIRLRRIRDDVLKIGLTAPREVLYEKINNRVYQWIEEGIVDEVKNLRKSGISKKRFRALGLEYSVVMEYLEKKINIDEMIEKMQIKVRQYAKRQITWFKKEKKILWFDIISSDYQQRIEKLVNAWYYKGINATED